MTRQILEEFCSVCGGSVLESTKYQAWHRLRPSCAASSGHLALKDLATLGGRPYTRQGYEGQDLGMTSTQSFLCFISNCACKVGGKKSAAPSSAKNLETISEAQRALYHQPVIRLAPPSRQSAAEMTTDCYRTVWGGGYLCVFLQVSFPGPYPRPGSHSLLDLANRLSCPLVSGWGRPMAASGMGRGDQRAGMRCCDFISLTSSQGGYTVSHPTPMSFLVTVPAPSLCVFMLVGGGVSGSGAPRRPVSFLSPNLGPPRPRPPHTHSSFLICFHHSAAGVLCCLLGPCLVCFSGEDGELPRSGVETHHPVALKGRQRPGPLGLKGNLSDYFCEAMIREMLRTYF